MRKYVLLLILLIIGSVTAANIQYGEIRLKIINRPPNLLNVSILPEIAYFDSNLECFATFEDERPEKVSVLYRWYKNGEEFAYGKTLTTFNDNDHLRCEVVLIDDELAVSETGFEEIKIIPTTLPQKMIRRFSGATVAVIGTQERAGSLLINFFVFLVFLIGINIIGVYLKFSHKNN